MLKQIMAIACLSISLSSEAAVIAHFSINGAPTYNPGSEPSSSLPSIWLGGSATLDDIGTLTISNHYSAFHNVAPSIYLDFEYEYDLIFSGVFSGGVLSNVTVTNNLTSCIDTGSTEACPSIITYDYFLLSSPHSV